MSGDAPALDGFARLCRVERERDLLRHTVNGWAAWAILRKAAGDTLAGLSGALTAPRPAGLERIAGGLGDLPRLLRLRPARVLVKTYTSGLLDEVDGCFKDIWFDDLLADAGSWCKLEVVNNPRFAERRRAALRPSDLTTQFFDLLVGSGFSRLPRPAGIRAVAAALAPVLQGELGLRGFTREAIEVSLASFCWQKRIYSRLLARVRPRVVLTADAGEHALAAAARERGIPVLDLQHGINDRRHGGYAWTDYARPYRPRLPIANRLLLYGDYWRRELELAGDFWGDDLRVVGNLRMEEYRQRRRQARAGGPTVLLFTTQGLEIERATALLRDFLNKAAGCLECELWIKLHPIFDPDPQAYLTPLGHDSRVRAFAGHQGGSTFELLTQVDLHLSISSACHYDALGMGVPTVVLPLVGHKAVLPLVHAGHASIAHSGDALLGLARDVGREPLHAEVSKHYFAADARQKLKCELEDSL